PGRTPHPRTNPAGHSYGAAPPAAAPLVRHGWAANQSYLFGVDLYNLDFWWEAHEEWEGLWGLEPRGSTVRRYLQGLIQVAAAMIRWEEGNRRGLEGLAGRGLGYLQEVADSCGPRYTGLEVTAFAAAVRELLAAEPPGPGRAPAIWLASGGDPAP
ncbi:MAG: DUF309 domain-containing protein, partial [Gemmatimonadota bacterium]